MSLGDFLAAPRPRWDWQTHDCSRWLDAWVVRCGRPSPIAAIGLQYDDLRSAMAAIEAGGGLLALWRQGMTAIGAPVTDTPLIGAAAVLSAPTDDGLNVTCGIWTGKRWVSVHRHGLTFGVGRPLEVWRV